MEEKLKQEEKQENVNNSCMTNSLKISKNTAINNFKPKNAPGLEGVSKDMLECLGLITKKILLEIFSCSWNKGLL